MPTYVYRGLESGEIFEVDQRMTEAPLKHHPQTGEPVSRVIQATGIVFKGSGFYKTDSRGSSGGNASKAEGSEASKVPDSSQSKAAVSSDASPSSPGQAKPASAPEPKASGKSEPKASSRPE